MDIDLLSKMVKELILDRDRVVLPGLGTFVAEMMPATFSDKGFTINPPYRRLYFRTKQENDTALCELYAESNGVGTDVAERILTDFLNELKQVLKAKKTVVFPGLGRLRATKENNFFFVPDEDLDIYPEGFGLEPISLKTHQETDEELSAKVSQLKSIIEPEEAGAEPAMSDLPPEKTEEESAVPAIETPEDTANPTEESADRGQHAEEAEPSAPDVTVPENAGAHGRKMGPAVKAVVIAAASIILLLVLYIVLSQLFPGLFDSLLYDSEQLEILDYVSFVSCK